MNIDDLNMLAEAAATSRRHGLIVVTFVGLVQVNVYTPESLAHQLSFGQKFCLS